MFLLFVIYYLYMFAYTVCVNAAIATKLNIPTIIIIIINNIIIIRFITFKYATAS